MRRLMVHRFLVHFRFSLAAGLVLFLSSCDSAPGPRDPAGLPPDLSAFSYTPQSINLPEVNPDQIGDGVYIDPERHRNDAVDPDGEVAEVVLVVRPPTIDAAPVLVQTLNGTGNGPYELIRSIDLPSAETGNYTLLVYAVDDQGLLSNQVLGTFTLSDTSEPPVIVAIEAPDTVQRPEPGGVTVLRIVAVVSDPDGLANISRVVLWNAAAPADRFDLFDDGRNGGDQTAGDGRFTITVQVESDNPPGPRVFVFQAIDRSGLESDVVEKTITIE